MAPTGRLAGKSAIITGSSSGLGRAIAILYAQEGASIVCADLRQSARKEIPNELQVNTDELIRRSRGKAIFVKTDVGEAKDMEALVSRAVSEYGRLDMHVTALSNLFTYPRIG
jgi:NAD(P)-dependent dehydrogenase (short-subunit alcohol dehydrogenase family)